MQACRRDACILAVLDRRVTVAAIDAVAADVLRMTELDRFFLRHLYAKSMTVMSRSSAEPTVMPRARGNSAIRPGAVGGELLQPCRPRRDRSVRFRAFDDCVQDGQDARNRRAANAMPHVLQRTLNPRVAPGRVVLGHPHDQMPDLGQHTPRLGSSRVGPFTSDELSVPPQQGIRRHDRRNLA